MEKSQGLPMETIVIVVLIIIVLSGVGLIFYRVYGSGKTQIGATTGTAQEGMNASRQAAGIGVECEVNGDCDNSNMICQSGHCCYPSGYGGSHPDYYYTSAPSYCSSCCSGGCTAYDCGGYSSSPDACKYKCS